MVVEMSDTILTDYTPIEFQYQELDLSYQQLEPMVTQLEPMDTDFVPMKVDWVEAKSMYVSEPTLTYKDIADKYSVSLKQVKKWGGREQWSAGRQEVSQKAFAKVQEQVSETAAQTTQRHIAMYQQAQDLTMAYIELLQVNLTAAIDAADREERILTEQKLPSPSLLLQLTRDLTAAINGERVCLGLPTKVEPAPVGWKPPVEEDPELAKLPFMERIQRILNQDS